MTPTQFISSRWAKFVAFLTRVSSPIIGRLTRFEPLPEWTNRHLLGFAGGVWAFALSLSWFADSRPFILIGLTVLAVWFVAIFIKVESVKG